MGCPVITAITEFFRMVNAETYENSSKIETGPSSMIWATFG
jgi:hypothetical protein